MKQVFTLLFLVFLQSCQSQTEKKPQNQNLNQITINVIEPINDYKIQILWIPNLNFEDIKLIGPAIIKFKNVKSDKIFYTINSNFYFPKEIENITFDNDSNVLTFEPTTLNISADEVGDAIIFMDVDFDNEKELITKQTGMYGADIDTFKFYNCNENEFEEISGLPFEEITNLGKVDFDYENKEITIKDYYSCCEWDSYHYKLDKNKNFMQYKTENHNVDVSSGIDSIIIKEVGKKEVKKTEKVETN
jgi:hypothetical protein